MDLSSRAREAGPESATSAAPEASHDTGSELTGSDVAARSDVGVRRSINQDRCGDFEAAAGTRLFVVADGMGGHQGGEVAAQIVIEACAEHLGRSSEPLDALAASMLTLASTRILERSEEESSLHGMGSTGTLLLLDRHGAGCVGHVGDSRAYRIRGDQIEALTEDHSLVASMVRAYQLDPVEAEEHPRRNELVRSLGVDRDVEVDVRGFAVEPGDRFLLCSDGLWGQVSDAEMLEIVTSRAPEEATQALVDLANARGGPDNVTVQIVVPHVRARALQPSTPDAGVQPREGTPPWPRVGATLIALTLVLGVVALLWLG